MLTLLEVIKKTADFLEAKGVESPRLNAEILVGHVLGLRRMQLYLQFERPLTEEDLGRIRPLAVRRGKREPLAYVVGAADFCGLKLKTDRRALIPRPETERLVEIVTERAGPTPPARVLDLGTGTGALALALARAWPAAAVTAVDRSADALALAGENAEACGLAGRVNFIESDWLARVPPEPAFDLIVSNPPYLAAEETAAAAPEVREHEPVSALTAGEGGLADLRAILRAARPFLAPGGWLALETGCDQHAELRRFAAESGWARSESLRDLAGRERFILAFRS